MAQLFIPTPTLVTQLLALVATAQLSSADTAQLSKRLEELIDSQRPLPCDNLIWRLNATLHTDGERGQVTNKDWARYIQDAQDAPPLAPTVLLRAMATLFLQADKERAALLSSARWRVDGTGIAELIDSCQSLKEEG